MYHYRESGLPWVWLQNGYARHRSPYGATVSFTDADGLHRAIAAEILATPAPLTGAEFRFLRTARRWSQRKLATLLGCDEQTVARWEKGQTALPRLADVTLRTLSLEEAGAPPARLQESIEQVAGPGGPSPWKKKQFVYRGGWRVLSGDSTKAPRAARMTARVGNTFADPGVDQPGEELAKAQMAALIRTAIRRRRLTPARAATLLGLDQPQLSALLDGRLGGFSSDRLMRLLTALGQDVEITVKPAPRRRERGKIRVVA